MTRSHLGVPWMTVAGLVLAGFLVAMLGGVRLGGSLMALGLLAGAAMRAVLPERYVLDIKVRSRPVDIAGYTVLAVVAFLAFTTVKLG